MVAELAAAEPELQAIKNVIGNLLAGAGLAWLMLATPQLPVATQLRDGTTVHVRLVSPINSEDAKPGDRIGLLVTRDVVVDGAIVIARRTPAEGTVVAARRASWGFIWHHAVLAFTFNGTTAVDGQPITLRVPNGRGPVNIDRSDYHHNLQWATEGDTFEAFVAGNYELRVR